MQTVDVPGKGQIDFPDDFTSERMDQEIMRKWPDLATQRSDSVAREPGAFSAESDYVPVTGEAIGEFAKDVSKPFVSLDPLLMQSGENAGPLQKIAVGAERGLVQTAQALETPLNVGLAAAAAIPVVGKPLAIAAAGGFGLQSMISGSSDFYAAVKRGDLQAASEAAVNTVVGTLMLGGVAKGMRPGVVPPSGIKPTDVAAEKAAVPLTAEAAKSVGVTSEAAPTPVKATEEAVTLSAVSEKPTPVEPVSAPTEPIPAKEPTPTTQSGEQTLTEPPPETPVQPGEEGLGAARTGTPGRQSTDIEQLTDVIKGMPDSEIPMKERFKASVETAMAGAKTAAEAATGAAKGAYAWMRTKLTDYPRFTKWKEGLLKWDAEDQLASKATYEFGKENERAIPEPERQAAIGAWIDSGGDVEILKHAESVVPDEFKGAYRDAQNLTPEELNLAKNAQNYFDSVLQDLIDNGMLEHGVENYIHRIFKKDSPQKASALADVNAGTLPTNPSLIRKRIFKYDYEAIQAGENVVQNFADRLMAYDQAFKRALSARTFVKWMQEKTDLEADERPMVDVRGGSIFDEQGKRVAMNRPGARVKPRQVAGGESVPVNYRGDYISYDHPAFRNLEWEAFDKDGNPILKEDGTPEIRRGDLVVHPEALKKIEALLDKSWWQKNKGAKAVLKVSSAVKSTKLDLSLFHPVQLAAHAVEHGVTKLVKLDVHDPAQRSLIEHGLTVFDHHQQQLFSEGLGKNPSLLRYVPYLGKYLGDLHDVTFKEMIPRMKMSMALDALERNRKRFPNVSEDDLQYLTGQQANAAFGGQNLRDLGMHPSTVDALRALLLAPDFLISRGRFVGQGLSAIPALLKGKKGFGFEQLKALALGAAGLWMISRLLNKTVSGEWRFDDPFEVVIKGRKFGIRTVQEDLWRAVTDPRSFWMARVNPTTVRTGVEALTGRDWRGVQRNALEQGKDFLEQPIPMALVTKDDRKLWETALSAMGLTVKRESAIRDVVKMAADWRKKNNIRQEPGDFQYDPERDPYRRLKIALAIDDEAAARKAWQELRADPALKNKASSHMNNYLSRSFSGSQADEGKFKNSLSGGDLERYNDAVKEKRNMRALLNKVRSGF